MTYDLSRGRWYGSLACCAAMLAAALIAPVMGAPLDLPALQEQASGEHHVGKVLWAELVTPDMDGAKRFYSGLFGWSFRDIPVSASAPASAGDTQFAVALLDGQPVAAILRRRVPPGTRAQPAWLTFLAVQDVDATARAALAHGAKMLAEPKSYGRRGRQAILADPQGAVFAILASTSGDPPDILPERGQWIWASLLVHDPDKDAAFFQTLLGYDVYDLPSDDGREHVILSSDNFARASVNALPEASKNLHSHWLNFVRVQHADDSAAKAISLGGRVLVAPHIDRHGVSVEPVPKSPSKRCTVTMK